MGEPRGFFRSVFATTTGWAMILCVAGLLGTLAPGWVMPNQIALDQGPGVLLAVLFLFLFLFLVATGNREAMRPWQPLVLTAAGVGAILLAGTYFIGLPRSSLGAGPYLTVGLGIVLLFLAALQLRGLPPQDLKRLFGNSTAWAMLFSLLGAGSLFLPWGRDQFGLHNGLIGWPAIVAAAVSLALFVLLLATSPLTPVPLWRALLLAGGGVLVVVFAAVFIGLCNPPVWFWLVPQWGAYVGLGMGIVLLLIAALEIRGVVFRRSRPLAAVFPAVMPLGENQMREGIRDLEKRVVLHAEESPAREGEVHGPSVYP